MAETRTTYFELPTYSSDSDETLTREDWVEAVGKLEARAAYDDGTTAASLPVDHLKPGRYARQSFADGYALHRRSASAWEWVGGTVATARQRMRGVTSADVMLSADVAGGAATATLTAGGELGTSGLVRSVAGGAFGADLATDLSVPSATGRLYARTRADGERAVVARAHGSGAGALYSAVESGGSVVWSVGADGRMRSSVPAALGAATPTSGVALAVAAPNDGDAAALRAAGRASGVPGLRVLRDLADADDILAVGPDTIRVGRDSPAWPGGVVEVRAPNIDLVGAVSVDGVLEASGVVADTAAVSGVLSADTGAFDHLTSFGGRVIPIVSNLAAITEPAADMWVLLTTDRVVYRYSGVSWVAAFPAGPGTSSATRHDALYVKSVGQDVASTASAFALVKFETAEVTSDDVTPTGVGNTSWTLNKGGLWEGVATLGYVGGPAAGRRGLLVVDNENTPTKIYAAQISWPTNGGSAALNVTFKRRFNAGTIIKVVTLQDSGVNLPVDVTRDITTFGLRWVCG